MGVTNVDEPETATLYEIVISLALVWLPLIPAPSRLVDVFSREGSFSIAALTA